MSITFQLTGVTDAESFAAAVQANPVLHATLQRAMRRDKLINDIGQQMAADSRVVFRRHPQHFKLFLDERLIPGNKRQIEGNRKAPKEWGNLQYYLHLHRILIHASNKKFHQVRKLKPKLMELAGVCMAYYEKTEDDGKYLALSKSLKGDYDMINEWCDL